jgi:protein ImuA
MTPQNQTLPSSLAGVAAAPIPSSARWVPGQGEACRHGEIFAPAAEATGAALALALALDGLRQAEAVTKTCDWPDRRPWLWVQDKAARRLGGRPYGPGMPAALRHRLVHVAAASPEDALFALEEGVRCRDLAFVVGEIAGNPKALGLTASRRLSLAAEKHGVLLWLVRLDAVRDLGSARMRWAARAAPSLPPRWNPQAPGAPAWHAELFRARSHVLGEWVLRDDGKLTAGGGHALLGTR